MKFTLSWLKEYLDTDASLDEICETLTAIGLELEDLTDPAAQYAPFSVAEVTAAEQHPDADKLKVLSVDTKDAKGLQIVCGAPNARAGMKGIFAPEGSAIPGLDNLVLKKTKIRGVESNGMMVSEKEMCLSDEHKGIIEVDSALEIGTPMAEVFGLNDPVIEIGLTPNRADCAGVYGIARDLAAAGLGTLKPYKDTSHLKPSFTSDIGVTIKNTDGCPHFLGREIKKIKNGPSPEWLQNWLKAVGQKPISALVDVTNFFTLSYARPLHVYDVAKLKGSISVGTATGGEALDALNDKQYELIEGATTINDDSGVIGLGGIVGGTSTGCGDETTSVYLEAAYFTPEIIARTGRDLGIISDARYRFKRGVDPQLTAIGMELATSLILHICGTNDTQISEIVEAGAAPDHTRSIAYDPALMKTLIGLDVPADQQFDILQKLGFTIDGSNVQPPSWRGDIFGAPDLCEEVIRIIGLDSIPAQSITDQPVQPETPMLTRAQAARKALSGRGLHECMTWSFISNDNAQSFGLTDETKRAELTVVNAISSEIDVMRPSILPNLIQAAGKNAAMGYADNALYEVGPVFDGVKPQDQRIVAAGIRAGSYTDRHWSDANAARNADAYDAKADALAALEAAGAPSGNAQISRDAPDYFHPGRSGILRLGKNVLAAFGELHPAVLEAMDVKGPISGFEVYLDSIPEARKKGTEKPFLTLEPLQPVRKDFAFIVDADVVADTIIRAAISADKKLITGASVFDIYQGKGVEDGKKSVAIAVTLQPKGESLTDDALTALYDKIAKALSDKVGGILRR